jgi:hypothetical protein
VDQLVHPSRFVAELPKEHIEEETTMTGGESLWRAQWSERGDPFAHLAAAQANRASTRGPGWQRARGGSRFNPAAARHRSRASPSALGNKGRDDLSLGQRVFHGKFGYGTIAAIEGNKLEIDFEHAGRKKVLDSFVSAVLRPAQGCRRQDRCSPRWRADQGRPHGRSAQEEHQGPLSDDQGAARKALDRA